MNGYLPKFAYKLGVHLFFYIRKFNPTPALRRENPSPSKGEAGRGLQR